MQNSDMKNHMLQIFKTILPLVALLLFSACESVRPQPDNSALLAVRAENGTVIDVRTPSEFAMGHLHDAKSIPLDTLDAEIETAVPDKNTPIGVYCKGGVRAKTARNMLLNMGYKNVRNLGGYEELKLLEPASAPKRQ